MKTPYEILDVAANANDVEIKQAYLRQVKENPPDRNQEQFQLIHDAYTSIKDHKSRLSFALFNVPAVDFDELVDQALDTKQIFEFDAEHFNKLLHASIDDTTIQNALTTSEK
jgi:DnaJ-class molecular chaperone